MKNGFYKWLPFVAILPIAFLGIFLFTWIMSVPSFVLKLVAGALATAGLLVAVFGVNFFCNKKLEEIADAILLAEIKTPEQMFEELRAVLRNLSNRHYEAHNVGEEMLGMERRYNNKMYSLEKILEMQGDAPKLAINKTAFLVRDEILKNMRALATALEAYFAMDEDNRDACVEDNANVKKALKSSDACLDLFDKLFVTLSDMGANVDLKNGTLKHLIESIREVCVTDSGDKDFHI